MASENKRQNAGQKVPVALPKTDAAPQQSASQMMPQDAAMHAAVGSRVRVSTAAPVQTTVEGTIYTADSVTNLLVLNISPAAQTNTITASALTAPSGSYRIIPMSQITYFQLLNLPPSSAETVAPSAASNTLDTTALQNRLNKSVAHLQTLQSRQGPKGTTPEAQALFDAFSRTMPTKWTNTSMLISDTYIIEKPYLSANVKLVEGARGDLDRMKRVLDMEKSKVALKMGKGVIDGRMERETMGKTGGMKKGG